jgi:hypothetical protein
MHQRKQYEVEDEVFNLGLNKDLTVFRKLNVVCIRNRYVINRLDFR